MKILIINPNSDSNTDRIMAEKAKKLALPEVEVVVKHCENAPKLVGNWAGQASSIPNMVDMIRASGRSTMLILWPAILILILTLCVKSQASR